MFKSFTIKSIAAGAILYWAGSALAHENHGLTGSHWHASDAWGFVALAAMVAVALWLGRGGK
jgi:hypothetical protein